MSALDKSEHAAVIDLKGAPGTGSEIVLTAHGELRPTPGCSVDVRVLGLAGFLALVTLQLRGRYTARMRGKVTPALLTHLPA
jgi:hypothetical protein